MANFVTLFIVLASDKDFIVMLCVAIHKCHAAVARELEAMAEPQPKVLNLASIIFPSLSTSIWKKTQKSLFWCYAFLPTSQFTERKMGQVNHTWLGRQKKY